MKVDIDPTNWVAIVIGLVVIGLTATLVWRDATRRRTRWLLSGVVLGVVVLVLVPFVHIGEQSVTAPDLAFRALASSSVPQCITYQGDGRIPNDGRSLMIFDRPVDDADQAVGEFYMNRDPAMNNENGIGWRMPELDLGARRVEIAAVLVSDDLLRALLSIKPNGTEELDAWKFGELPPGQKLESLRVNPRLRTDSDPSGCD